MAEDEILLKDLEIIENVEDTTVEETIQLIEVDGVELFSVDTDDAFAALGETNEDLKHSLLNDRDMPDQHPIIAITGLREELDAIEALQTVYSDAKQTADYYRWNDDNVFRDNRVGYFVSLCPDVSRIKICEGNDIFGVTVDSAAFIGGQDDVRRDHKYGLVMHSGLVGVRCEDGVDVGDFVVSNSYGKADKTSHDYGCKVIAIHSFDDVRYAIISLNMSIDQAGIMGAEFHDIGIHLNDLDNNVAAVSLTANQARQDVVQLRHEIANFEVEVKDAAQESKDVANSAMDTMNQYKQQIEDAQRVSAEAQAIASSAEVAAVVAKEVAKVAANDALTKVNDTQREIDGLVSLMEPLAEWTDGTSSGIIGFVRRADADSATLATLAEWKNDESGTQSIAGTVAKVNEHEAILQHITNHQGVNGPTIAQVEQKADDNGASITHLVASVDKYSVGEYSQAYGLTREQAVKILRPGYVYIPTENGYNCCSVHKNTESHCEAMWNDDGTEKEINEFTPGNYYVWTVTGIGGYTSVPSWDIETPDLGKVYYVEDEGLYYYSPGEFEFVSTADPLEAGLEVRADWVEYNNRVWFFAAPPANSYNTYKYWYLNSDTPSAGYEAYALYVWNVDDASWQKVNTLSGNASNRITSMIRQTTNEIAAEVVNARGDMAEFNVRVGNAESSIQALTTWAKDPDGMEYNLAAIKQTADKAGANIAQVVEAVGADGEVNAASIVTAVNKSGSSVVLSGDHVILNGATTNGNGTFAISTEGHMTATGGNIAGWSIGQEAISHSYTSGDIDRYIFMQGIPNDSRAVFGVYSKPTNATDWQQQFYVTNAGYLYAKNAYVEGEIKSNVGNIGGWDINSDGISKTVGNYTVSMRGYSTDPSLGAFFITDTTKKDDQAGRHPFVVSYDGYMQATKGNIGGWSLSDIGLYKETSNYSLTLRGNIQTGDEANKGAIFIQKKSDGSFPFLVRYDGYLQATTGNFADGVTIGGTSITAGSLRKLYQAAAEDDETSEVQIKRIGATSGSVGGWRITEDSLRSDAGQSYIASKGTFMFAPRFGDSTSSLNSYCGFFAHASGQYHLCIGSDCKLQIGDTLLSEKQLQELLKLIFVV